MKGRARPSVVVQERIGYIDYKDVALLERCVSDRSKIRVGRASGHDSKQQREVERAVKNAREMALLPYAKRGEHRGRAIAPAEKLAEPAPSNEIEDTE